MEKLRSCREETNHDEVHACPPIRIDREAWKPCDSCMSCSNCGNAMQDADDYPCCECIDQKNQCGLLQASMKYFHATGYCRHCGRPLTEAAWAKLEAQLRAAVAATKGEQHGE